MFPWPWNPRRFWGCAHVPQSFRGDDDSHCRQCLRVGVGEGYLQIRHSRAALLEVCDLLKESQQQMA